MTDQSPSQHRDSNDPMEKHTEEDGNYQRAENANIAQTYQNPNLGQGTRSQEFILIDNAHITAAPIDPRRDELKQLKWFVAEAEAGLKAVNSWVHHATSVALEIDRLIKDTMCTLFTNMINQTRIQNSGKVKLPFYERTWDPKAHMTTFWIAIGRAHLDDDEKEAWYFRFLVEHMSEPAL